MTEPSIHWYRKEPLTPPPTYIGECCREWILAVGAATGTCGICGEHPTFKRVDTDSPHFVAPEETA